MSEKKYFKIMVVGPTQSGKTSFIKRFVLNDFNKNEQPTIGIDLFNKKFKLRDDTINLQIIDIGGQSHYQELIQVINKDIDAYLIIYDCTNTESVYDAIDWTKRVRNVNKGDPLIIVGTKVDLIDWSNFKREFIKNFFKDFYINRMVETSAKKATNINFIFKTAIELIMDRNKKRILNNNKNIIAEY